MDTIISARVISSEPEEQVQASLDRALGWFLHVEQVCSRFDTRSELFRLCRQPGRPVEVSHLLFEAVRFSLLVAQASGGLFDPTVGAAQARRGFDRNYVTGDQVTYPAPDEQASGASYRDLCLDPERRTITLRKPLLLDLGAVVKGMAIDLAARDLGRFRSFSIDAGGDVRVKGHNERDEPWRVGIEHPRGGGVLLTLELSAGAVCTSGDYERRAPTGDGAHHLLDPLSHRSASRAVSCTVVAESAMVADALSTAAFIGGPDEGLSLLVAEQVDGLLVAPDLTISTTPGFERWLARD